MQQKLVGTKYMEKLSSKSYQKLTEWLIRHRNFVKQPDIQPVNKMTNLR
jgi:hypothetical protein